MSASDYQEKNSCKNLSTEQKSEIQEFSLIRLNVIRDCPIHLSNFKKNTNKFKNL